MDRESLGKQAPPTGHILDSPYTMHSEAGLFTFGRAGKETFPLHLAFGSGKSGMAFITVLDQATLAEARVSWFPPGRQWYMTPGQENVSNEELGNISRGAAARQCLGCHTITLPRQALMPEQRFMGIGCESCHGPGKAHIAVMQSGGDGGGGDAGQIQMKRLGSLHEAARQSAGCADRGAVR